MAVEVRCNSGPAANRARPIESPGYEVIFIDNVSRRVRLLAEAGYLFATR